VRPLAANSQPGLKKRRKKEEHCYTNLSPNKAVVYEFYCFVQHRTSVKHKFPFDDPQISRSILGSFMIVKFYNPLKLILYELVIFEGNK